MTRTITVKGVGSATAKPDYVIISMTLDAQDMKYEKAMELAAVHLEQLKASLAGTGFDKEALKTTNFNVRTDYQNEQDGNGTWKNVFNGYIVSHSLKIAFDFDAKRLPQTLGAIADCVAKPCFLSCSQSGTRPASRRNCSKALRRTQEERRRSCAKHRMRSSAGLLPSITTGQNSIYALKPGTAWRITALQRPCAQNPSR